MNADHNDAPLYLRRHKPRANPWRWLVALVIGTSISLGLLFLAGKSFDQSQLASTPAPLHVQPAPPAAIAPIQRTQPAPVIEARAAALIEPAALPSAPVSTAKQTVFNDRNYQPKPLVNSVAMAPVYNQPTASSEGAGVVTGIKEKPMACWPFKEGSIEYRDCKRMVQLSRRNR
jgi:hypothetical protein